MPYFNGFCGGFHPTQNAFPRFSTHPNLELIPTHLELFQHPPQLEHPLFTWNIHPKFKQLLWGEILSEFFFSASLSFSTLKLHFVDPNFSIPAL